MLEPLRSFLTDHGYRVHVPLLPGHDPDHPWDRKRLAKLSVADIVESIYDFIQEKEFKAPPILIGHSMGGLIAQMLAARRSVAGLILLNSAGPKGVNHIYPVALITTATVLSRPLFWKRTNRLPFLFARFGLLNRIPLERAREIHRSLIAESGRCLFEVVFWFLDKTNTTHVDTEKIVDPVLIVSSGRDRIMRPIISRTLKRLYPAADTRHFPRNGHWLAHEAGSHMVFREIVEWLDSETSTMSRGPISKFEGRHHELPGLSALPIIDFRPRPGWKTDELAATVDVVAGLTPEDPRERRRPTSKQG